MASNSNPRAIGRSRKTSSQSKLAEKLAASGKKAMSPPKSPDSDRGSPGPTCVICLGKPENKSFTNSCLHEFCFTCILEWSKVKPECPLCKQHFSAIIHNVKSNHEYEEYKIQSPPREETESFSIDDHIDLVYHRFRYRTTMTQERRGALALERLIRMRQFSDDGVLPTFPTAQRPYSRPRRSRLGGTSHFRKQIYQRDLWVQPLSDATGRFRDTSPEFFQNNQAMVHRLVPWLNRELNCLLAPQDNRLSYVLELILRMIKQHHISSRQFREAIQQYMGDNYMHFIHEFYQFARSPYDMYGFDDNANYEPGVRLQAEEVAISESSEDEMDYEPRIGVTDAAVAEAADFFASDSSNIVLPSSPQPGPSGLTRAAFFSDDGQSYSTRVPSETTSTTVSGAGSGGEEEIEVVQVLRPRHERTPEVITLSDTDEKPAQETSSPSLRSSSRGKALKRQSKSPVIKSPKKRRKIRATTRSRADYETDYRRSRYTESSEQFPLRYWDLEADQISRMQRQRSRSKSPRYRQKKRSSRN